MFSSQFSPAFTTISRKYRPMMIISCALGENACSNRLTWANASPAPSEISRRPSIGTSITMEMPPVRDTAIFKIRILINPRRSLLQISRSNAFIGSYISSTPMSASFFSRTSRSAEAVASSTSYSFRIAISRSSRLMGLSRSL